MGSVLNLVYDDWPENSLEPNPNGEKYFFKEKDCWQIGNRTMNVFHYQNYRNCKIEEVEKNPDTNFYYLMWNRGQDWGFDDNILPLSENVINLIKRNKNLRVIFINEQEAEKKITFERLGNIIDNYNLNPKQFWLVSNNSKMLQYKNELNSQFNIHTTRAIGYAMRNLKKLNFLTNKENIFLCHNRIPKTHRNGLLCLLKKYNILDDVDWSLIDSKEIIYTHIFTDNDINILQSEINFFENKTKKSKYETEFDWFDDKNNIKWSKIYHTKTFENSYFNIATETLFDNENIHITEKSFKPFCYYQFPLILSSRHHIKTMKEIYNFDFFDDIINHDYDNINNNRDRLFKFVEEIKRIHDNKEFFINFYENNKERFENNFQKMVEFNVDYDQAFFNSLIDLDI